ncbi:aspartate dehydrogenase [Kerstersia gyiorum]|nr:aspartate dehydrogenase [Kerstersia gyiorum]MCP1824555.1 aspartate dehydrogenase [Kerstersia gyiorum]MCP1828107.1 aspartate dehydrogenase [Kerstersia gyiorum]MCW2451629.1 aspartate dehydrogenase [Kerstersia gyiorum]
MDMLRIALIGFGAIGSALVELLEQEPAARITVVVTPDNTLDERVAAVLPQAQAMRQVPLADVDLVVEAAGHGAVVQHVLPALRAGVPCIVASMGAMAEPCMVEQIEQAAEAGGTQAEFVAGAIGAIDVLAAARLGGLAQVRYTGRKPPQAWRDTPAEQVADLAGLAQPQVIFEGTAREAARQYPRNANVAATVALAGLGLDATQVRLVADPGVRDNIHTVEAEGAFGSFELSMRNLPLASNPKTSAQTVYSLARAIHNRVASVAI